MRIPTFADVEDAAARLRGFAVETPLLRSDALDSACDARVFVKAECLQRTGSFKFRGAYNRISRLTDDERKGGVVAFSSGNHAQGVAAAAALVGCPALIVMPSDSPAIKADATRGFGAEVIFYDRATEDREAIGRRLAAERGAVLVPPYDDAFVMAGQGTVGLEAARQAEAAGARIEVAYVCTSGGGLVGGVALALENSVPGARVWVVEPEGFDDYGRSLAAGERVSNPATTGSLCDALLVPTPGALTWEVNRGRLAGGVAVSDAEALAAVAFAFRHLKLVLEPSGAVALAAALKRKSKAQGRDVLVVASGGNVDPTVFARAIGV